MLCSELARDRAGQTLPESAAWRLLHAVDGFEVAYCAPGLLRGHTSVVEDGEPYAVRYRIRFDDRWHTREARISADTVDGEREVVLASDGEGHWIVDGTVRPDLDGLLDLDLEASACTNTLPLHRLSLPRCETVRAPAVYVQALGLTVRRLDQTYRRLDGNRFHYTSEGGFEALLSCDDSGLVVDYPGIAARVA